MKRPYQRLLILFLMVALALPLGVFFGYAAVYRDKVYPGVAVAGIDLGGLTKDEAKSRLLKKVALPEHFTLTHNDETWTIDFAEIGAKPRAEANIEAAFNFGREGGLLADGVARQKARSQGINLPLSWQLDKKKAAQTLDESAVAVRRPAVDAKLLINYKDIKIQDHQTGREMRTRATLKRIKAALEQNRFRATAVIKEQEPAMTTVRLRELKIQKLLGEFSTSLSRARDNRRENIQLAVNKLNDLYIKPGEVASFNKTVGSRTAAAGFKQAPVILDGNLVPGIGGGICQVATTLYNAAMSSGLPVVERSVHSNFIDHYPAGRDATVVDGNLDLKFRNDTNGTLLVRAEVQDQAVLFRVYGPDTGRTTVFGPPVVTNVMPFPSKIETDTSLPPGTRVRDQGGVPGRTVQVSRKVTKGNKVLISEVTTSRYLPRREIIRVGPAPPPAPETSETTSSVSL